MPSILLLLAVLIGWPPVPASAALAHHGARRSVSSPNRSSPGTARPMRVSAAFSLCRSHPSAQTRVLLRGWFLPGIIGNGYTEGALFDSKRAVPITTFDQWETGGHWSRYGALYAHITTQEPVGPRSLTLHGRLACSSHRFWTDRDPFPRPRLHPSYGTRREPGGSTTTWATAGGLKLSLTIPRSAYPRDAMAQVTVSIRNISRHAVGYQTPGVAPPGVTAPQVEVLDHSGRIVFPPAMPDYPPWPGPPPFVVPLQPGQVVHTDAYIVVRGARLRASVTFNPKWTSSTYRAPDTLRTRPIWVKLTSEPAPRLTLHLTSSGPVVDVTRPSGVTGSPLEIGLVNCNTLSQPFGGVYVSSWTPAALRIRPGCSPVQAWNLRVAWLNHPVAVLDYSAPQPTPTAGPAPTPAPVPTWTPIPSPTPGPSFDDLLHRAARAEAAVHSLHATGQRTSVDSSAQMHLGIRADCRSSAGQGVPILARSLITGRQSQVGKIDRGYIVEGPVLRAARGSDRAWFRSPATHGRWQATDLRRTWALDTSLPDPVWSPDPAYLNQICPDLIRLTYLSAPLPFARHTVLGTATIAGRRVWHLREHLYFNLDLFVDTRSFQLRRLVLWDGSPAASHWRVRFDYVHANTPIHIPGT